MSQELPTRAALGSSNAQTHPPEIVESVQPPAARCASWPPPVAVSMLRAAMAAEDQRDEASEQEPTAADEASRDEAPPAKPRKKGKKKDRRAQAEAKKQAAPPPGAGTPDGGKLREALRAFDVGDYARVRARTRELASAEDRKVREAAADLASRIAIDPVQIVVILACALVLGTIAYVWVI
jgi:hypothetical protein